MVELHASNASRALAFSFLNFSIAADIPKRDTAWDLRQRQK